MSCIYCHADDDGVAVCDKFSDFKRNVISYCDPNCESRKKSNADRIRAMTDEELAAYYFTEFFREVPYCHENCPEHDDCQKCLLEWLKVGAE